MGETMSNRRMVAAFAGLLFSAAAAMAQDSAWIRIFNGKDLNDWDIKFRDKALNVNLNETFKVVDGLLTVDYSKWANFNGEPFGHAAYKVRKFSHYLLRSEYRFHAAQVTGGPGWARQNNGFMLHSQSMASMTLGQDFPVSMETQLLGPQNGGSTMNLCTPGTHYHDMAGKLITDHCVNASNITKPAHPNWTSVSALVLGDSLVKHMVGKDTVFRYTKPVLDNMTPLKEGYIAIQAESSPIQFRSIDVLDLVGCMDKSKPAYRAYFVKHDANACNVTALPSRGAREAAYRLAAVPGGWTVAGEGHLEVTVSGLDGAVQAASSGKGTVAIPAAGPGRRDGFAAGAGLRLVRVSGPAGSRTYKLPLP